MAPRIQMMTPGGIREYPVYNDNRVLAADFAAGEIWSGVEVIYRSLICEVVCDFIDDEGVKYCELLFKEALGGEITFTVR